MIATTIAPWRPQIFTSVDDEPLAVSIQDLFLTFPYDRVTTDNDIVRWTLYPEVMIGLVLAYVASKPILTTLVQSIGFKGTSNAFRVAVATHNFGLALFSGLVMLNSFPIVISHFLENGLDAIYCDRNGSLWNEAGLGAWATIFYISKFYEFADTWILIFKGKKPSFLQTYHHIGVVISIWGAVVSHAAWMLIVVLLNSTIHTLMYSYFFVKTIYPSWEIQSAKYLTTAQIVQFFTGTFYTLPLLFLGTSCESPASLVSVVFSQLYAVGLIILFVNFASKKYNKKQAK